jgi:hypothetical protein
MSRIALLFVPSILGLLWQGEPQISIIWSLMGSFFVAAVALSRKFTQLEMNSLVTRQLLRPFFMFQLYFLGLHVIGAGFYCFNTIGYEFWNETGPAQVSLLEPLAKAQALMLLAHASVTAGMKLVGFQYRPPPYNVPSIPPYILLLLSLVCLIAGSTLGSAPTLKNITQKILQIGSVAVLVEITFAVAERSFVNGLVACSLLLLNLVSQTMSGWKGLSLWTMITLGGMLYPLMPRRVLVAGCAFAALWLLFLHPFGLVLRPLIWKDKVDQHTAAVISFESTMNLSWEERLENVWTLMVERASDLYQFEKYVNYVPETRPYYKLELMNEALMGLVPRVIWQEKPNLEKVAMERVYEAGIVLENTDVSAKSNLYQDAYLSGGWMVVISGSLLFGALLMIISRTAERLFGGYELGTCLIFTSIFGEIVQSAPNFLFLVGSVGLGLVVMFGLFVLGRVTGWIAPVNEVIARPAKLPRHIPESAGTVF